MKQPNFWDRLFPAKYDFHAMITSQTKTTAEGITAFKHWLQNPEPENAHKLRTLTREADTIRLGMESCLMEAFITPFDRQDIYSLSVEMDRVIECVKSLMELMIAYEVASDDVVLDMVLYLEEGTDSLHTAVCLLKSAPLEAEKNIANIRRCQSAIEEIYRHGSAALFKTGDIIRMAKYREIYHVMMDAAIYLGYTADIFHKIVVRIV